MAAAEPDVDARGARRFESDAIAVDVRDRARRMAMWVFVASIVPVLLLPALVHLIRPGWVLLLPVVTGALWACAAIAPRLSLWGPRSGVLEARDDALTVTVEDRFGRRRTRTYPLDAIVRGHCTNHEVRLETRRGEMISIGVEDPATGEAVLRAAQQDARQRALEMPIASIASRVPGATVLAWVWIALEIVFAGVMITGFLWRLRGHPFVGGPPGMQPVERIDYLDLFFPVLWWLLSILRLAGVVKLLVRRKVTIGMDGIRFRRFFRRRFHPHAAIADVALGDGRVILTLRSGKRVPLRTASFWQRKGMDAAGLALYERVESSRADAGSQHDVRAKLPLLERRGRAPEEWRAHLASLMGKAGYRTGALTSRDLAVVIEDASLSAEHRVAAAVALSAFEPEEARSRARIAAAASADEELHAALEQAAEGELDEARLHRLAMRARG